MKNLILGLLLVFAPVPLLAADPGCLDCHESATPAAVAQWRASAHYPDVDCSGCHGTDHQKMLSGEVAVTTHTCGNCHEKAFSEHASSKHSLGLHSGWGCTRNMPDRTKDECKFCHDPASSLPKSKVQCARFLKQTSQMRSIGCNRCHQVENSCQSCHGNHLTDLAIVQSPRICAKCHMGPDHPQWEMWETSLHGSLNLTMGEAVGPSCQRCHMPQGSHDVSQGITVTTGGDDLPAEKGAEERQKMIAICSECHAPGFVTEDLATADAVRLQANELTARAAARIRDINAKGLLDPAPDQRPPHPLNGNELVLDAQMLYEDNSHLERLFFKMKKYDHAKTWKGAYHQNPAYTHWYGNAELKMDLVDIEAEARRLEKLAAAPSAPATGGAAPQEQGLETLTREFEAGKIDEQTFRERREQLLLEFLGEGGK